LNELLGRICPQHRACGKPAGEAKLADRAAIASGRRRETTEDGDENRALKLHAHRQAVRGACDDGRDARGNR